MTESDQAAREAPFTAVRLARRDLFPLIGAAALATFAAPATTGAELEVAQQAQDDTQAVPSRYVYVGTYTAPNTAPGGQQPSTSRGIYVFKMDGGSGSLSPVQVFEVENPSWVCVDTNATHLYATSEVTSWNGASDTGGITSFSIDAASGRITSLGNQATAGARSPRTWYSTPPGSSHWSANYIGANWSVLPVRR